MLKHCPCEVVLLSLHMHCGTSCTRTRATLSQKSLTQKEVESKMNILAYTPTASLI